MVMPAETWFHGSDHAEHIEESRVRRDLQIEIHHAVNQDAGYPKDGG
jgi:predicted XRE-type DNA-binding protein